MIIDTTQTEIERDIASVLDDKITYSSQKGFFLTRAQSQAIFWEQLKEWKARDVVLRPGDCNFRENEELNVTRA